MFFLLVLYVQLTQATTVANPVELINQDALLNGFCHIRLLELKFRFNCMIQSVAFSVVANTTQDGDYLVQCHWNSTLLCTPGGVWERDNGTLLLKTIFNHSAYAGHKLRAHLTCKDTNLTSYQQHYLLKPCLSEFTANATIKGASIAVDCQHSSSNHSMSGMCIVFTGDYNGTCSLKTCTEVQRLPNGIRYIGNYTHDMRFICTLDSASYEITNITYISGPVLTSDSGQTRISFEMVFISVFFFFGK